MPTRTFANSLWRVHFLILAWVLLAVSLYADRKSEIERHRIMLETHSDVLMEAVGRSLSLASIVESATLRDSADVWQRWNLYEGRDVLRRYLHNALPVRHVVIFDEHGDQKHASFEAPAKPFNVADYPAFIEAKEGKNHIWYGPYLSPNSGRRTYSSVQRLGDWTGKFSGVMATTMDTEHFGRLCKNAIPGAEYSALILTPEERIIAACAEADVVITDDTDWQKTLSPKLADLTLRPGVYPHGDFTVSTHRNNDHGGYYVVMVLDHSKALGGWFTQRVRDLSLLFFLALMMLFPWLRLRL